MAAPGGQSHYIRGSSASYCCVVVDHFSLMSLWILGVFLAAIVRGQTDAAVHDRRYTIRDSAKGDHERELSTAST